MEEHDKWRASEAHALSNVVQKRLHFLQNPKDCSKARKLICNLNKVKIHLKGPVPTFDSYSYSYDCQSCGYGCQIHHAAYCFIMAYATKRTMILNSKKWRYHRGGWETVFLPVSDTCTDPSGTFPQDRSNWPGIFNSPFCYYELHLSGLYFQQGEMKPK